MVREVLLRFRIQFHFEFSETLATMRQDEGTRECIHYKSSDYIPSLRMIAESQDIRSSEFTKSIAYSCQRSFVVSILGWNPTGAEFLMTL